jgi:tetratricopeptide (TPR) repeat protein
MKALPIRPAAPRTAAPAGPGLAAQGGLLLLAVLCAYLPALKGGFLWDDDAHVTGPALRSLHGLVRIWFDVGATQQYYPVLHSAFWVEHRLWGDSVLGYHLANVAFHAAAAALLVLILRRLAAPAPMLAGLIFALHPVCVESVAWISEQKNTLSAVFYLGAALLYLRFDETRRRRLYFLAFALFVLALLTKTVTATLPAALLVVFWWQRGRIGWKRDVAPLLPWLAFAVAAGLFTAWAEARLIGAEGEAFSFTVPQRLLLSGRVIAFYFSKLCWPTDLIFIYPRWSLDPRVAGSWAGDAAVAGVLLGLALFARHRRGPLAGFLFFTGTLFPVLGFVNVYPFLFSFVADHFQYLASLGVIVPAAWGLAWIARRIPAAPALRVAFLAAVPATLGVLSWRQCRSYRDADTLYRATLARNPAAWLAHFNLAVSLGGQPGREDESVAEYEATLRLNPAHWAAHNNLASALLRMPGRTAEAAAEYEQALRLRPDFAEAQNNLGVALGRMPGRRGEAIAHLRIALRIRPDYDGAHNNLGTLLVQDPAGRQEAIGEYEAAIRLAPDNAEYHYNLGNALSDEPGRLPEAIAHYRTALRLRPGYVEAHANLASAYARSPGRLADAIAEFETVTRLEPDLAEAHFYLGVLLLRAGGGRDEALAQVREALRLRPDLGAARRLLDQMQPGR